VSLVIQYTSEVAGDARQVTRITNRSQQKYKIHQRKRKGINQYHIPVTRCSRQTVTTTIMMALTINWFVLAVTAAGTEGVVAMAAVVEMAAMTVVGNVAIRVAARLWPPAVRMTASLWDDRWIGEY